MYHDPENVDDSKLKGLGVTGGFTTPPFYFSHLQNHILNRTSRATDFQSEALEDYFKQSRSAILQKTVGSATVPKPLTVWYHRPVSRYLAAASLTICLSLVFWLPKQTATQTAAATLSEEEIMLYLERSDLRDVNMIDVNFTSASPASADVEQYIISQSEDPLLLENL
jgi:hypothetical protein